MKSLQIGRMRPHSICTANKERETRHYDGPNNCGPFDGSNHTRHATRNYPGCAASRSVITRSPPCMLKAETETEKQSVGRIRHPSPLLWFNYLFHSAKKEATTSGCTWQYSNLLCSWRLSSSTGPVHSLDPSTNTTSCVSREYTSQLVYLI